MIIERYHHPIWTLVGIHSIARGTLALSLFGPEGYATLMGRLARPSLMAGAASPTLGAMLLEWSGTSVTLATLLTLALLNVLIVGVLFTLISRPRA